MKKAERVRVRHCMSYAMTSNAAAIKRPGGRDQRKI